MAGGVNLYSYAGNNPVSFSDPFGLCPVPPTDCFGPQGVDLAVSLTPGLSTLQDAATAVLGRNPATGEAVGLGGRLVAAAGAFTPASGGEIRAGIGTYRELKAAVKGMGLEVHHIIEKRFAALLGADPQHMLAVALPRDVHRQITALWRKAIPYGRGTANATRAQVAAAAEAIYREAAALAEAARKELGH